MWHYQGDKKMGPSYTVVEVTADTIFIRDDDVGKSVTNCAENVCSELVKEHGNKRVFYRDTDGVIDEIEHIDGEFLSFAPCSPSLRKHFESL